MNETWSNDDIIKDHFAVAQVALYIFAILQVVVLLMTVTGAVPLSIALDAPPAQRIAVIANAVLNVLFFLIGYVLLARCLTRCSRLVWKIALAVFLANTGMAVLTVAVLPSPQPVLVASLSIAGAISVWKGRTAIHKS
ncbi:TPA: hypothetical protein QDC22_000618 [Burkholderia stabilis]|nr:hypothetical protein [Burkholderia stabilis]HDR9646810.1 hypothetical protein [Burkholderia stabilis]HDR9655070.1 hypothetical protein [Burkholderia stabilis]HDR9677894.1 hypothetical protein [Burkholderia stabilis]